LNRRHLILARSIVCHAYSHIHRLSSFRHHLQIARREVAIHMRALSTNSTKPRGTKESATDQKDVVEDLIAVTQEPGP